MVDSIDMLGILINIALTFIISWALIWAFFAWGLGVNNFAKVHGKFLGSLGHCSWILLMAAHFYAIFALWMDLFSASILLTALFFGHLLVGLIFARNVSAR